MNKRQLIFLWSGIGALCLMLLFPPWRFELDLNHRGSHHQLERDAGYSFCADAPAIPVTSTGTKDFYAGEAPKYFLGYGVDQWNVRIDKGRLVIQMIPVVLVTAGFIFTCHNKSG